MRSALITVAVLAPSLARAADFGVNATNYDGGAWSPYVVGAAIGVLSWLTFYFADKTIGASSFSPPSLVSSASSWRGSIPRG